jgi:hypothetical protein
MAAHPAARLTFVCDGEILARGLRRVLQLVLRRYRRSLWTYAAPISPQSDLPECVRAPRVVLVAGRLGLGQ